MKKGTNNPSHAVNITSDNVRGKMVPFNNDNAGINKSLSSPTADSCVFISLFQVAQVKHRLISKQYSRPIRAHEPKMTLKAMHSRGSLSMSKNLSILRPACAHWPLRKSKPVSNGVR